MSVMEVETTQFLDDSQIPQILQTNKYCQNVLKDVSLSFIVLTPCSQKIPFNMRFFFTYLAKRCQCLGSFNRRNYSLDALDMFCRNDTTPRNPGSPTYRVMDSLVSNSTAPPMGFLPQIIPNKTRCGNLDPVEMNITNKCYCLVKDKKGAGKSLMYIQFL